MMVRPFNEEEKNINCQNKNTSPFNNKKVSPAAKHLESAFAKSGLSSNHFYGKSGSKTSCKGIPGGNGERNTYSRRNMALLIESRQNLYDRNSGDSLSEPDEYEKVVEEKENSFRSIRGKDRGPHPYKQTQRNKLTFEPEPCLTGTIRDKFDTIMTTGRPAKNFRPRTLFTNGNHSTDTSPCDKDSVYDFDSPEKSTSSGTSHPLQEMPIRNCTSPSLLSARNTRDFRMKGGKLPISKRSLTLKTNLTKGIDPELVQTYLPQAKSNNKENQEPPAKKSPSFFSPSSSPEKATSDCPPGTIGFPNHGNTCYINAVMQGIMGLQPFVNDILSYKTQLEEKQNYDNSDQRSDFAWSFHQTLESREEFNSTKVSDSLRKFKEALGHVDSNFLDNRMQDAHEFLLRMLNTIKDELSEQTNQQNGVENGNESGGEGSQKEETLSQDPVTQHFQFTVLENTRCPNCEFLSSNEEKTLSAHLCIPKHKDEEKDHIIQPTLQQAMKDHMAPETREVTCEKCDCTTRTVLQSYATLPRVLIIQLKRFSYNYKCEKISDSIVIPSVLCLDEFVLDDVKEPPLWKEKKAIDDGTKMNGDERVEEEWMVNREESVGEINGMESSVHDIPSDADEEDQVKQLQPEWQKRYSKASL